MSRTYYLTNVAAWLSISPQHLRVLVSRHPSLFGPPQYRRKGRHPRLHRVFRAEEVAALHSLLLVNQTFVAARTSQSHP